MGLLDSSSFWQHLRHLPNDQEHLCCSLWHELQTENSKDFNATHSKNLLLSCPISRNSSYKCVKFSIAQTCQICHFSHASSLPPVTSWTEFNVNSRKTALSVAFNKYTPLTPPHLLFFCISSNETHPCPRWLAVLSGAVVVVASSASAARPGPH